MLKRIKNTSNSIPEAYTRAKSTLNITEQLRFAENVAVKDFWGNSFPTNLNFGHVDFTTNYSGDPIVEWKYIVAGCIANKEKIFDFAARKLSFEQHILQGRLAEASESLDEIRKQYGESLWLINSLFLLAEQEGGREANWSKLGEILKTKEDGLFRLTIELVSKKNESLIRFDEFLKSTNEQISSLPVDDAIRQFIYYCLGIRSIDDPSNSGILIYLFTNLPIIDRYLFMIRFSELLYVSCSPEKFKPFLYPIRTFHKSIDHSPVIRNILLFENQIASQEVAVDEKEFEYVEAYLSGDIDRSAALLEDLIINNFRMKYLLDYYTFLPITHSVKIFGPEKSLLNELSKTIQGVVDKGEHFVSILRQANKLELQMTDFCDVSSFTFFIGRENSFLDQTPYFNMLRAMDDDKLGVSMLFHFGGVREIQTVEDLIQRIKKFSAVTNLVERLNSFQTGDTDFSARQSFERLLFGQLFMDNRRFDEALGLLRSVLQSESLYESAIAFLKIMEVCVEERRFRDLMILFDEFLKIKPGFFERANLEFICREIDDTDFENVDDLIITPIIFSKAQASPHAIYGALDSFLISHGASKPSELLAMSSKFERGYFLWLLNEVCVIDVLKYFTVFENTAEVETERLKILKYLVDSELPEENRVIDEIVEVTQRETIRRGLRTYNSGKITMNFLQLRRYITDKLSSAFSRFKDQKLFVGDNDYKSIDYDGQVQVVLNLNTLGTINRYISLKDPSFLSLKLIVNEIRDIFLNSKEYGLDSHLSTRIRHGMLVNHIKRVFVNHHLLAVKEGTIFKDIAFWNYVMYEKPSVYQNLQKIFQDFSLKLDAYCQKLRTEFIQIKTEKDQGRPNALFDFSFLPEFYTNLYAVVEEHNIESSEFVDYVLFAFLKLTNINLDHVRDYLRDNVNADIRQMLEEMKVSIQDLFQDHLHSGVITQVNKAATEITYELESISRWFQLAEEDTEFKLQLADIISIAVKVNNILYPTFQIDPVIESNSSEKLTCSIGIIDILRNLLDNVVAHSGCDAANVDLKVNGRYSNDDGVVKISISHNLGQEKNIGEIRTVFDEYRSQWNNKDFYGDRVSNEGKSGIKKIRRSIEYDLGASESSFDFTLDSGSVLIVVTFNIPQL